FDTQNHDDWALRFENAVRSRRQWRLGHECYGLCFLSQWHVVTSCLYSLAFYCAMALALLPPPKPSRCGRLPRIAQPAVEADPTHSTRRFRRPVGDRVAEGAPPAR